MSNVSSSNSHKGNTPNLRFHEFSDDWKLTTIGGVYDERTERGSEEMELLSVTMNEGVKRRSEIEGKDNSSEDKSNYKIVHIGDMVYNSMRMWQGASGISQYYGIVSPAYTVLKPKIPIANEFFAALFKTRKLVQTFQKNSQGLTSDTWNLKYPQIAPIKISIPSLQEQTKIAKMLTLLDLRIKQQEQLVSFFKLYKRGLLSLVFDDKSPTHILEDILQKGKAGGTPQSSNATYYNGDIPFLSIADMTEQGKYIYSTDKHISEAGLQNSTAWIVPNDSLILSMYASYGLVSINKVPLATSQAMFNMIFRQNVNVEYIYYYLTYLATTDYYTKKVSTGTQPNLNAEKVKAIPLYIPSQNEQKHIVEVLQIYDNRLTKEEKILTQLQASKAALLQQLFI